MGRVSNTFIFLPFTSVRNIFFVLVLINAADLAVVVFSHQRESATPHLQQMVANIVLELESNTDLVVSTIVHQIRPIFVNSNALI